ncbi:Putative beta-lactamase hcpC precursor [Anaerobiospirillum thomasii]|uniref:tetratricopeptide repeat protein n=1 Tax=Anaerobiospirillum thomasii TaxID=179995 RepID=UPI000D82ED74|nr:tetratricopeptide repeat protein [Anaerobiospirillum thomasii]SPT68109.1 Putative beta-lactamase hcpC precursor [Anaerobiospirillum thomasii]
MDTMKRKLTRAEKEALKKRRKARNKIIMSLGIISLTIGLGGMCIYWGVASYYKEIRNNNLKSGIASIEQGNLSRAVSFLKKSYDQGELDALAFLAWLECSRGNYEQALKYARVATTHNIASAYEVMGDLSLLGYGQATGVDAAISFFEQGAALDRQGRSSSLRGMLSRALPLVNNIDDFRRLMIKAVSLEEPRAYLLMGDMLFLGDGVGVNPTSAINNWQKAQILGVNEATTRLAGAYFHGYGVDQNLKKSLELYAKAAEKKDPIAYYSLGLITLRNDSASEINQNKAINMFKRAMNLKYAPAASALALLEGDNIDDFDNVTLQRVVKNFKFAYEHGDDTGALFYSLMLASGTGVKKDYDTALAIIYDANTMGSLAAADVLKALSANKDPKVLLKQAFTISHNVLLGNIIFFEGAPEASAVYHDGDEHGFELLHNLKGNMVAARVGSNFPEIIKDVSSYDVDGELLITPMVARILVQAMPSTGAKFFNYVPKTPSPLPPPTPQGFGEGRDFIIPDFEALEFR